MHSSETEGEKKKKRDGRLCDHGPARRQLQGLQGTLRPGFVQSARKAIWTCVNLKIKALIGARFENGIKDKEEVLGRPHISPF